MRAVIRSLASIALTALCMLLPYRWMWPVCALAATLIILPRTRNRWQILRRDGLFLVGSTLLFVCRRFLDPMTWAPWVGILALLTVLRDSTQLTNGRRRALALAAWLAAYAVVFQPLWTIERTPATASPTSVLVCLGDSLTAGVDIDSDAGTYVAALRGRLGCTVINAGRANDRVADALARVSKEVIQCRPTAVVIFIGGNDYLDGTPRTDFAERFDKLVARIASCGARIVIVEVPSGILLDPYAGVYRRVAAKYGAELVPESWLRYRFTIELLWRDRMADPMTIDGIHLSPSGAEQVATWLEPAIRRSMQ